MSPLSGDLQNSGLVMRREILTRIEVQIAQVYFVYSRLFVR